MQLSIIIVNYNVKYFLEQCLYAVMDACKNITTEIFVVDNNSTDGSKDFLSKNFPSIYFIWNDKNIGFAKANNLALASATGKYILFLNPDTIVPEDCFEKCILFFENHPQAGALGIRMIDGSGNFLKESKRSFPSPITSLYKLSGLAALFPRSKKFGKYHLGHLSEKENHEVDVLAGAFMMIPKIILDKVGSFDEQFFMYGEDVDLSYRIQKSGYKNYYFSESTIIHFKGESTKKGSLNYVKLFYNAMSLFVKKHYGDSRAGLFNFFIQLAIILRAVTSAVGNFIKYISLAILDAIITLTSFETKDKKQIVVVANNLQFNAIKNLMQSFERKNILLGSINNNIHEKETIGKIDQLLQLIKLYNIKEIIFCKNEISYKQIIEQVQLIPKGVRIKYHAANSSSIIGSDDKDIVGSYISTEN